MNSYDVIDHLWQQPRNLEVLALADVVIALCGSQFFTIKDRNAETTAQNGLVPSKPDLVIAYSYFSNDSCLQRLELDD